MKDFTVKLVHEVWDEREQSDHPISSRTLHEFVIEASNVSEAYAAGHKAARELFPIRPGMKAEELVTHVHVTEKTTSVRAFAEAMRQAGEFETEAENW